MFTVCPKCMLTLAVTAADLRMGQGYVRCGRCANVFNALLTLSEEPVEDHAAPATAADPASQSQIVRALRQDRESLEQVSAPAAPESPGSTAADQRGGQPIGDEGITNTSTFDQGTGTFETIVLEGEAITQTEEYVPEESVDSEIASLTRQLEANAQRAAEATADTTFTPETATAAASGGEARTTAPSEPAGAGPAGSHEAPAAGHPAQPGHPEHAETAGGTAGQGSVADASAEPFARPEPPPQRRWPWIGGSAALGLLLLLQIVHHWRDALAENAGLRAPLSRIYAALGMPLDPHWDLSAYDVRQQGAAADPSDGELVHVRLSLANHALRPQPLPLLRLTLLDRYGKRIARGELTPAQYWPGGAAPNRLLAHDERVDCDVAVRDPGAVSASFELDVCLRDAGGTLRCAGDAPAR